jgi:hypothetical protein
MSDNAFMHGTSLVKKAGANAIPSQLHLANRPLTACPVYVRQYKTYPNNGLTNLDGSQIIIPVDTSTLTCFLNRLQVDFSVTASAAVGSSFFQTPRWCNSPNRRCKRERPLAPRAVYQLPNCSAMSFFSNMQIVVQGCPIEEILGYNVMAGIPDRSAMEHYIANGKPLIEAIDTHGDWFLPG